MWVQVLNNLTSDKRWHEHVFISGGNLHMYFCSKALAGAETRHQKIEKIALTMIVVVVINLGRYFLTRPIIVRTDQNH